MTKQKENIDEARAEMTELIRELNGHCFNAAAQIETTSVQIHEKMNFMISIGAMGTGFVNVLGTINGLTIGVVRLLQKVCEISAKILEETHTDQVEVALAPEEPAEMN